MARIWQGWDAEDMFLRVSAMRGSQNSCQTDRAGRTAESSAMARMILGKLEYFLLGGFNPPEKYESQLG